MQPATATRLLAARDARVHTDYVFEFWTQLGWTILTCGVYRFYVMYRSIARSAEHNRRRRAFLEAANAVVAAAA